jgi:prevent-host-death family protein
VISRGAVSFIATAIGTPLTMADDHGYHCRMADPEHDVISVSEFKATCLAVLERVRRTGRPVLVTKRGEPLAEVVPPSPAASGANWLGAMRGTARITGDLVRPASDPDDWDALRGRAVRGRGRVRGAHESVTVPPA